MEENARLLADIARHTDKIEELGRLLQVLPCQLTSRC